MAQHQDGTVTVAVGSNTVAGVGTNWTTALVNGAFKVVGQSGFYTVASVASAVSMQITPAFAGAAGSAKPYVIVQDFTPEYGWKEVHGQDRDWPEILSNTLRSIDAKMKELDDRITVLEP